MSCTGLGIHQECIPGLVRRPAPGLVPDVLDIYGKDLILLVSGGIHGHPKGTRAGAKATMQAIEAWQEGVTLDDKAKTARELHEALKKWGYYKPK